MNRKMITLCLALSMLLGSAVNSLAGGRFESFDITAGTPSPIPGHILARVNGIFWDARSIPVKYSMNNTLDPIPNPLGPAFLSVADATTELQNSMNAWNSLPSSYIDMQITGTTDNPGLVGFNMVNELSFRTAAGFTAIASSPSVNLISDTTLNDGDQIDGDADSDVSSAITTAQDVDNDGDIEYPAGFYKAGTILDNDVQFNTKVSNGLRFTIDPAQADTVTRSVDLKCVAVHELGHSLGLAHSFNNQNSATDGDGATMFPFIDTGDPDAELGQAMLDIDDIAWASYIYPEGSAASGPAALQPGDVDFDDAFGLIKGELTHGVLNQPIAGGILHTLDQETNTQGVSAYSGTTNLSFNPVNGGLFFVPTVADAIPNGNYVIPVPKGQYYVSAEAADGSPTAPANIGFTPQIGGFFGQHNFIEEFYNNNKEAALEFDPGDANLVAVNAGMTLSDINIVTNSVFNISGFGARNAIGFINPPAGGFIYATQFPASQISALNGGNPAVIQAGLFDTTVVDASVPVVFAEAWLAKGVINPDTTATIDLITPLARSTNFLGQDTDFAPFYFPDPKELSEAIYAGIADGSIQNLFLVLQIPPAPFAGVSAQPPLIGLSSQAPILGRSFLSTNGGLTFTRRNDLNFRFSLISSVPPPCVAVTCPDNITKANDPNQCGAVVTYVDPTPEGSSCGTNTCSPPSGSFFPKGTTTVTCTASAGPSCGFTITVNDTQPPTIVCPLNQTRVTATPGAASVVVTYPEPVATDNCPMVSAVCAPPSGATFKVGVTSVTCTATDMSGNTKTCSFPVSVYNACLQDDSNATTVLLFNTLTGDYRFCCNGTVYTGKGTVVKHGNTYTLNHTPTDRRLTAKLDSSTNIGTANLQSPPGTIRCTITDRNITNNSCSCQ